MWLATSFLGVGFFSLSSLSLFLPLVLPSLGVSAWLVLSDAFSFFLFCRRAFFFTWAYFLLKLFFFHMAQKPLLWVEVGAHAVRKRSGSN